MIQIARNNDKSQDIDQFFIERDVRVAQLISLEFSSASGKQLPAINNLPSLLKRVEPFSILEYKKNNFLIACDENIITIDGSNTAQLRIACAEILHNNQNQQKLTFVFDFADLHNFGDSHGFLNILGDLANTQDCQVYVVKFNVQLSKNYALPRLLDLENPVELDIEIEAKSYESVRCFKHPASEIKSNLNKLKNKKKAKHDK